MLVNLDNLAERIPDVVHGLAWEKLPPARQKQRTQLDLHAWNACGCAAISKFWIYGRAQDAHKCLISLERATGLEPATFSLGN